MFLLMFFGLILSIVRVFLLFFRIFYYRALALLGIMRHSNMSIIIIIIISSSSSSSSSCIKSRSSSLVIRIQEELSGFTYCDATDIILDV